MTDKNKKPYLNNDLHFLVSCCKTDPSEDDIQYIHTYLSRITDHGSRSYNDIIHLAYQHGIVPLVYKTLKKLLDEGSLKEHKILSAFKQQYLSIAQRNMLMSAELIRIMKLLEDNSIEALAFKGPTLAQMAYEDITLRQYSDLDILVKKEDIYKIDALLKDHGYQRVVKISPIQEKVYIQNTKDLGFYHTKSGLHLEMHWSLLNEDYPMQLDLDTIWKNPQTVKINQEEIKTFPIEEILPYLCIHGSKHLWDRIEWIKDIDLLIRKENIDWGEIVKKVDGTYFEAMIYLGLSLAMHLFKTPLPKNIIDHISDMKVLDTLSDFVLKNWQSPKNMFQRTHAMLKLLPGIKRKSLYLHKILIKPSLNDYCFIDLPKPLYFGYYFVHPYLLLKKYCTRNDKYN